MKPHWMFALGLVAGICAMMEVRLNALFELTHRAKDRFVIEAQEGPLIHTEARFEFVAKAPLEKVAPLMGADRERVWAPGWDPKFVYPKPASDRQGMVFTIPHGHTQAAWVNTEFDLAAGRVQYVYVIPETLVTVITIRMTVQGDVTNVAVKYDRTALTPEANDRVQHLAQTDRNSGPEWESQINGWLGRVAASQ